MEILKTISNENLANYIMFKSDKIENGFTEEELNKITEVVIDFSLEKDSSSEILEELLNLKKLQIITLRNGFIFNDDYKVFLNLPDLKDITFEKCEFENPSLIASLKLKALSLIDCDINEFVFVDLLKDLEELTIVNGNIEIEKINKLDKLKYLQISYSNIIDNSKINIKPLKELYVDNTNINTFEFLNDLVNINRISVDRKQYDNNEEIFKKLMENDVLVMEENMIELGGKAREI